MPKSLFCTNYKSLKFFQIEPLGLINSFEAKNLQDVSHFKAQVYGQYGRKALTRKKVFILTKIVITLVKVSRKIFEHFALQADPVIEFIQLRSPPFKRRCHFGAKTSRSTFLLEKQLHPL